MTDPTPLPVEDLTAISAQIAEAQAIPAAPAAEVPLIWTTLGNVPVSALQHHIKWDRTAEYIKFTEVYMTSGGMVVKESSHVLSLTGQAVGAEQAGLA